MVKSEINWGWRTNWTKMWKLIKVLALFTIQCQATPINSSLDSWFKRVVIWYRGQMYEEKYGEEMMRIFLLADCNHLRNLCERTWFGPMLLQSPGPNESCWNGKTDRCKKIRELCIGVVLLKLRGVLSLFGNESCECKFQTSYIESSKLTSVWWNDKVNETHHVVIQSKRCDGKIGQKRWFVFGDCEYNLE